MWKNLWENYPMFVVLTVISIIIACVYKFPLLISALTNDDPSYGWFYLIMDTWFYLTETAFLAVTILTGLSVVYYWIKRVVQKVMA
ncbi:hypothetical protein [Bacillus litorisediminis]|uniref:hypothetical protein n=1 Tax=Bacillus litorisediminis TaxID=2922713 RepID=UPI001FAF2979|nr:hypothetical protein [Bacillus litorisediminis]